MKQRISDEHYSAIWTHTLKLLGRIFLITVPIAALSLVGGRSLDRALGTSPRWMIGFGLLGFVLIARLVSKAARSAVSGLLSVAKETEEKEELV